MLIAFRSANLCIQTCFTTNCTISPPNNNNNNNSGRCVCLCVGVRARARMDTRQCRSQKHSKTSTPQFHQTTTGSCIVFPTKKAPSKYVLCGFSGFRKKSLKSRTHVPESLSQFTLPHVSEPIYIPWSLSTETCLHRFAKINTIEK